MVVNNSVTRYKTRGRVFLFSISTLFDIEPTQNCSCLSLGSNKEGNNPIHRRYRRE